MITTNSILNPKAKKAALAFEDKANKLHNYRYNYEKSEYVSAKTKLVITCPIHGDFKQTPTCHLSGSGCKECGKLIAHDKNRKTVINFITEANEKYDNYYIYNKIKYINNKTPIIITCPIHGDFETTPHSHLYNDRGCKQCYINNHPPKDFYNKIEQIYGATYDTSKVQYTGSKNKIELVCNIHGSFFISPNKALRRKTGCHKCGNYPTQLSCRGKTLLYYLKIERESTVFKIGITTKSVKERYYGDGKGITVLYEKWYETGVEAFKEEQRVLTEYAEFKYVGPNILKMGNTELFVRDIGYGRPKV